jgi:hypothetical protein
MIRQAFRNSGVRSLKIRVEKAHVMKVIARLGAVLTLFLATIIVTNGRAVAAEIVPPLTWGPLSQQMNFPITAPGGEITTGCVTWGADDLQTYDNQGNVIRQIPRSPQVEGTANCVREPLVDSQGDVYGVLPNSDILVANSTNGVKWSKDLNCGTNYYNNLKVVVGGNGRIYTVASENGEVRIWGIDPNITPPFTEPAVVDNFVIPGSCSDNRRLWAYKEGLLIGKGSEYTYYSYAGKKLHTPPELTGTFPYLNAEGDAFYFALNQNNKMEVRKLSALSGIVLWSHELPNQNAWGQIYPTPDGGAVITYTGPAADQVPPTDIPYVNQSNANQVIFLDPAGVRTGVFFVRQPDTGTDLPNNVTPQPDVNGNVVLMFNLVDDVVVNGQTIRYRKVAMQVVELGSGTITFTEELRGDVYGPSPYGYVFPAFMLTDDIVYLTAQCSSPNFTLCDPTPKLFPITTTTVGMDYPRGAVLTAGTANQPSPLRTVVTGDSFASGQGISPYFAGTNVSGGNTCYRSYGSYARILGLEPDSPLQLDKFVACGGAKTDHITNDWTGGNAGEGPQAANLGYWVDVVALSIGGNDMGVVDLVQGCIASCSQAAATAHDRIDNELGPKLQTAYQAVLSAAFNAEVYVLGYPPMLSENEDLCGASYPFNTQSKRALAIEVFDALNQKIEDTVTAMNNPHIHFVNMALSNSEFVGHDFCSDTPYFTWFNLGGVDQNFHPNQLGALAYAIEVTKAL